MCFMSFSNFSTYRCKWIKFHHYLLLNRVLFGHEKKNTDKLSGKLVLCTLKVL